MSETLGFTGTQFTGGFFEKPIRPALEAIRPFDRYVTGGCVGFDVIAGVGMVNLHPNAEHVVVVPSNRYKVFDWWSHYPFVQVIEMPNDSYFRDRNQRLVDESTEFYYCALFPEKHRASRRSGTWQTVRMARRKGIPVTGIILNQAPQDDDE